MSTQAQQKAVDRSSRSEGSLAHGLAADDRAYLIDLAPIRLNSGPLWERTREGVFARLRAILDRLLPDARATMTGPDQARCIVAIGDSNPEDAAVACVRAAYELASGLLGRCELADLQVSRAQVSAEGEFQQDKIQQDELIDLADKAKLEDLVLPRRLRHKLQSGDGETQNTDAFVTPPEPGDLSVSYGYEPVWDARSEAVCMYVCMPQSITAISDPSTVFDLRKLPVRQRIAVDLDGLLVGIGQLTKLVENGDRFLLNAPISYETLSSPLWRAELLTICRGLLPAYRRYIVFTLTDIPLGVSMTRLSEFVMLLRGFGRVIATAAPGERNFSTYLNIGLSSIALDLSARQKDHPKLHSDIQHIAAAAKQFKLGAGLFGISAGDTTGVAHAADIRLFHGPAIGRALELPKRMTRMTRDQVVGDSENASEEDWI